MEKEAPGNKQGGNLNGDGDKGGNLNWDLKSGKDLG